ncbi:MAG: fumarylacetoacetate hydrolase family protein [Planctomycetota bacterium]|nr:fumarylacetoacetate hydrolase family protein [Planctomycetota bacterium]MDA1139565.1 fumarylacetoacetate hydrolase family protein [Planctomycetota bacterium]
MKLVTYEIDGKRKVGAQVDGEVVDLTAGDESIPGNMRCFLGGGEATLAAAKAVIDSGEHRVADSAVTIKAPIYNPEKVICVGLNYADHAAESGMAPPPEPVLFCKFPNAIIGPNEVIQLPHESNEPDYEVEMVIVIGKAGRRIAKENAMQHVAGYTVGHDVSARDWQLKKPGGQWMMGKTFDTFAPIGPAIVTPDEISDPHNLGIRLFLNGVAMQDSTTAQLIFKTDELIAYISQVVTLQPGDLIFTGTPPGVGFAKKPPLFLKAGDHCVCEVDEIGRLENPVE